VQCREAALAWSGKIHADTAIPRRSSACSTITALHEKQGRNAPKTALVIAAYGSSNQLQTAPAPARNDLHKTGIAIGKRSLVLRLLQFAFRDRVPGSQRDRFCQFIGVFANLLAVDTFDHHTDNGLGTGRAQQHAAVARK